MVRYNLKTGFSLMEAMVVMAIIAIFFAASAKVLTQKPKPKIQNNPHGYYECYQNGGLYQRYVRESIESEPVQVSQCTFEPPVGAAFFNINAYYSDSCYSGFEPNINNKLNITFSSEGIYVIDSTGTQQKSRLETNSTISSLKDYLGLMYPDSNMYNNGNILNGIFISW